VYDCGKCNNVPCREAERLAIERAAEVELLKASNSELLTLCRRMAALPGDYNLIMDSEAINRDLYAAIARETLNEPKPKTKE
jgi:hypothetical protein